MPCMSHVSNGCIVHCHGFSICNKALHIIVRIKFHDFQLAINLINYVLVSTVIYNVLCVLTFQIQF